MNKFLKLFTKENIVKAIKWFFFSYIWLGVLLFVIDIVSKHIALNAFGGWDLFESQGPIDAYAPFIPGLMSFTLTFNTGMAWGILGNADDVTRRVILIGVSLIMSIAFVVIYIWKFKKLNRWYKAFFMCLAAGAIGNLIDRALYPDGKVIDFIKFDFMPDFPVFNFADAVLVVTIIGMIIYMIVEEVMAYVKKRKNAAEPQQNGEIQSLNDEIKNDSQEEKEQDNNQEKAENKEDKNE